MADQFDLTIYIEPIAASETQKLVLGGGTGSLPAKAPQREHVQGTVRRALDRLFTHDSSGGERLSLAGSFASVRAQGLD